MDTNAALKAVERNGWDNKGCPISSSNSEHRVARSTADALIRRGLIELVPVPLIEYRAVLTDDGRAVLASVDQ